MAKKATTLGKAPVYSALEQARISEVKHKGFTTMEDILEDSKCQAFIGKKIDFIKLERRTLRAKGQFKKRDSFDIMQEQGLLKTKFFVDNYPDIFHKKSKLSGGFREIISSCVVIAIYETLKFYELSKEGEPTTNS